MSITKCKDGRWVQWHSSGYRLGGGTVDQCNALATLLYYFWSQKNNRWFQQKSGDFLGYIRYVIFDVYIYIFIDMICESKYYIFSIMIYHILNTGIYGCSVDSSTADRIPFFFGRHRGIPRKQSFHQLKSLRFLRETPRAGFQILYNVFHFHPDPTKTTSWSPTWRAAWLHLLLTPTTSLNSTSTTIGIMKSLHGWQQGSVVELQPNGVLYKTNATGELRHVEADLVLLATGYRRSKRSSGDG